MREFEADPGTTVHPQTVIEHFKSWNRAKRLAGLVPRRFATQDELLRLLRDLGDELGRVPTAKDIEARKGAMPSKSLYWHTFGSLNNALKQAGFDVPVGEERLERAVEQGAALVAPQRPPAEVRRLGAGPPHRPGMLTEWQVYRMFDARRGAWSTFQYLIRKRLEQRGVHDLARGPRSADRAADRAAGGSSISSAATSVERVAEQDRPYARAELDVEQPAPAERVQADRDLHLGDRRGRRARRRRPTCLERRVQDHRRCSGRRPDPEHVEGRLVAARDRRSGTRARRADRGRGRASSRR